MGSPDNNEMNSPAKIIVLAFGNRVSAFLTKFAKNPEITAPDVLSLILEEFAILSGACQTIDHLRYIRERNNYLSKRAVTEAMSSKALVELFLDEVRSPLSYD